MTTTEYKVEKIQTRSGQERLGEGRAGKGREAEGRRERSEIRGTRFLFVAR